MILSTTAHCLPLKGSQLSHLQRTSTPSRKVSTSYSINSESKNLILNLIGSITCLGVSRRLWAYANLGHNFSPSVDLRN